MDLRGGDVHGIVCVSARRDLRVRKDAIIGLENEMND